MTNDSETLKNSINAKFSFDAVVLNGTVRMEKEDGHKVIPQLVESFPGLIKSVTVGKPTLEDVFIHKTGERLP